MYSPSARQSFDGENGVGWSQSQALKQLVDQVGRIICFCTGLHGLVVRREKEGNGMDFGGKRHLGFLRLFLMYWKVQRYASMDMHLMKFFMCWRTSIKLVVKKLTMWHVHRCLFL